ncbi:uncharacterized protein CDAR_526941 [Caerostris darwini]|uniref:Uncharacterized protein n=1 Tax=Caerostris darwini TaxID=1538125 RepID=A0AAV4Q6J9_9ARAC|nr:uncharacterized protein CDAR_526941 [Caerostris darwini]
MASLLDHVENGFVAVQPDVMVGYRHFLESDPLGVLEERIGSPHLLEPANGKQAVLRSHVLWQLQPVILPALRHKDVGHICLKHTYDIKEMHL